MPQDVDEFPSEQVIDGPALRPLGRDVGASDAVALADLDLVDRARADDSPSVFIPAMPSPLHSRSRLILGGALAVSLASLAAVGAYLYERSRIAAAPSAPSASVAQSPWRSVPPEGTTPAPSSPASARAPVGKAGSGVPPTLPSAAAPAKVVTLRPSATPAGVVKNGSDRSARAPVALGVALSDLQGVWSMTTSVESATYPAYVGLRLGYVLELIQQGDRLTGTGQKVAENGRRLSGAARTPITVSGSVSGDRLILSFTEQGTRRSSDGKLVLHREDDEVLRGRFSSDAAQSGGRVEVRRTNR